MSGKSAGGGAASPSRDEVAKAVEWYASGEGMFVNQFLREGREGEFSDDERRLVGLLDVAAGMDDVGGQTLYRSVDAAAVFGGMSDFQYEQLVDALVYGDEFAMGKVRSILSRAPNGKVITDKGFTSTTEDYGLAADWQDFTGSSRPITLALSGPAGTRGCKVYELTPEAEARDPQREVLLPRNMSYRIRSVGARDGGIYVVADIVP